MDPEQFELLSKSLGALDARTSVNEFVLAALLAAHPNPLEALAFWNRHLAEAADRGFERNTLPAYAEVLQGQLAHWSTALQAAVARQS